MSTCSIGLKLIIVGETSVGKSCLMSQFTEGKSKANSDPTIGVEFGSKGLNLYGRNYQLDIWDTAGQEAFRAITQSYYRGWAYKGDWGSCGF